LAFVAGLGLLVVEDACHGEDGVCAPEGGVDGRWVVEVAWDNLYAFLLEALSGGFVTSRVTLRREYLLERMGSERTWLMTELPCWPVVPKTTRR
jgi:hypothetical protein